MQIGQVPIQYAPNATINDTQSITLEPDTGDTLIPSLQPFAPIPPTFVGQATDWNKLLIVGGLIAFVFWISKPGR